MSYAADVEALSPTFYYRLDDTSGSVAVDSSGNGSNGVYTGSYTLAQMGLLSGDEASSTHFTGGCVESPGYSDDTTGTAMAWATLDALDNSQQLFTVTTVGNGPSVNTTSDLYVNADGSVTFQFYNGSETVTLTSAAGLITVGSTHFYAAVWAVGYATLYVDGAMVAGQFGTGTPWSYSAHGAEARWDVAPASNSSIVCWTGRVQEAALFNGIVLTGAQIEALYTAASAFTPTFTIATSADGTEVAPGSEIAVLVMAASTSYDGTISLSSNAADVWASDSANLGIFSSGEYTFAPWDGGVAAFTLTVGAPVGTDELTVTDVATGTPFTASVTVVTTVSQMLNATSCAMCYGCQTWANYDNWGVGMGDTGCVFRTLLGFTLPPAPIGLSLLVATLVLYACDPSWYGAAEPVMFTLAGAEWVANTVTWNTMPSQVGPSVDYEAPAYPGNCYVPVTALVQAWLDGTPNYGIWCLGNPDGIVMKHYAGIGGATTPQLILHYGLPVPVCDVAPSITGTLVPSLVLTCEVGTWVNDPTFTYDWQTSADGLTWVDGAGSESTFTVLDEDYPGYVQCVVTATNVYGSVSVTTPAIQGPNGTAYTAPLPAWQEPIATRTVKVPIMTAGTPTPIPADGQLWPR